MDAGRSALIVASHEYQDPGLRQLRAPARDVEALGRVLGDPEIGGFEVRTILNATAQVVNEAVEEFFADRRPDDLLLLHFSCHGVKDEDGDLHFATTNTRLNRLGTSAIAADFVNRRMTRSRSRRIVLLLDCCYSGAFERGMVARGDSGLAIEEQLGGRGRAVITASTALEYAFEGDAPSAFGGLGPSVFTGALVEALRTGEADRDLDGRISLDELYDYVFDRVREATPHQTPCKWVFGVQGDLYIARSRRRPALTAEPLPTGGGMEEPGDASTDAPARRALDTVPRGVRPAWPRVGIAAAMAILLVAAGGLLVRAKWPVPHAVDLRSTLSPTASITARTSSPTPSPAPIAATAQSATTASAARCHTSQLSISFVVGSGGSTAGHGVAAYQLKNVSSNTCYLYGFVGMQMLDSASKPLPTQVVRNGGLFSTHPGPSRVDIGPNTAAFFQVSWSDVPVGTETICPQSSRLIVTPPDEVATLQVDGALMTPCRGGEIDVTPVVASLS